MPYSLTFLFCKLVIIFDKKKTILVSVEYSTPIIGIATIEYFVMKCFWHQYEMLILQNVMES